MWHKHRPPLLHLIRTLLLLFLSFFSSSSSPKLLLLVLLSFLLLLIFKLPLLLWEESQDPFFYSPIQTTSYHVTENIQPTINAPQKVSKFTKTQTKIYCIRAIKSGHQANQAEHKSCSKTSSVNRNIYLSFWRWHNKSFLNVCWLKANNCKYFTILCSKRRC